MCGIAALFSQSKPAPKHALNGAVRSLIHRGPDKQSVWISTDHRVGLGHTRLSIIDLATGDQPIANEDERLRIIVNGEFYDFERQRRELEQRGHRFRTRSDSEIALHLYEDFGAHCVRHLRGEFAFVLWDETNDLLLAARDRFGIKPLYYSVYDDTPELHLEPARRPHGDGALDRGPRAIPGSSRRGMPLPGARVAEDTRLDREISAAPGREAGDHGHRVSPAETSVSFPARDHRPDRTVPSNAPGHV